MKLFKNRQKSKDEINGRSQNTTAMLTTNATFPLLTFESFNTSAAEQQLPGSIDLQLYHNIVRSLGDSQSDSIYTDNWLLAAQDTSEDVSLIEGILIEDAVIGITQCFKFIKSNPISTTDSKTWAFIIDALCCACRLSCSPSFSSDKVPELSIPGLIFTVARLCDGVFRLANRHTIETASPLYANLPNVPPDDWTDRICEDIICGRGSAWIALAKVNAWQIGEQWPARHELYAQMRALFLREEMQQYQGNSNEHDMMAALDLAILTFAKTYLDISVKNRPSWVSADCLNRFSDVVTLPPDTIVFNLPELNGGYGDIFGIDPLEQVAFLSKHYREVFLNGS